LSARHVSARAPELRLAVPGLFHEAHFEQELILTFGADLEFYERVLRRHFGAYRNQIVLVDGQQLDRGVRAAAPHGSLRHLNRSWLAGPIRTRHAAHAKAILLAGPDAGVLLVGSGNLNIGGYAGGGECFTPYRWSRENSRDLSAFTAVRALTHGLEAGGYLDAVTTERLKVFWGSYDWWHAPPVATGPVRHNLDTPLGEQLIAAVGADRVEELVVTAPFYDRRCEALDRLASELRPRRLRVLVQPRHTSVDPKRLAMVLSARSGDAFAYDSAGEAAVTYLHAKIFLVKTERRAVCLTGSANCSMVALWARQPTANIELGNLASGPPASFDHLFDSGVVTVSGPVDPTSLGVVVRSDPDDEPDGAIRVEDLRWDPPVLSGIVNTAVRDPSSVTIEIQGIAVAATITLTEQANGSTRFTARLTVRRRCGSDREDRSGHCAVGRRRHRASRGVPSRAASRTGPEASRHGAPSTRGPAGTRRPRS